MKVTSWIMIVVTVAFLAPLGFLLLANQEGNARQIMEAAMRMADGPEPDFQRAVDDLGLALRLAETEADDELAAQILMTRADVLRRLKAYGPARTDLIRVLDQYRPSDVAVQMEVVELDVLAGDLVRGLDRATAVVESHPTQVRAWTSRGKILMELAAQHLESCRTILTAGMPDEEAVVAMELIQRITSMDPSDPLRVSLVHNLRNIFSSPDQLQTRQLMRLVDEASRQTADARVCLAQSFRGQVNREAALDYLTLLHRSGRLQAAIDFGLAVVPHRTVNSHPPFMEKLAQVLLDAGRPHAAADVIAEHLNRNALPGPTFYFVWAKALFETGRWKELLFVAKMLRVSGDAEHRAMSNFYTGYAMYQQRKYYAAVSRLQRFVRQSAVEPHPGAIAQGWRALAACYRELHQVGQELPALREAVKFDPDMDADTWLRLYQLTLERDPEAYDRAEHYLTNALRLDAGLIPDHLPDWLALGRRRLRAAGVDLELELIELRRQSRSVPEALAGPYEMYRLAELHFESDEHVATISACKRLLAGYPDFLPAVDLHAKASVAIGDMKGAARLWFDRLRIAGHDALTLQRIQDLPEGVLDERQQLELMELDPENIGRLQIARTLQREGRARAALAGLTSLSLDPLGDEGWLLGGELMLETGRNEEALEHLARVTSGSAAEPRALSLAIRAAMGLRDAGELDRVLRQVERLAQPDAAPLLENVDELLLAGHHDEAWKLLEFLDSRASLRSDRVLLRKAAVGFLRDDLALARESLERAAAFAAPGAVELGQLLVAVEERSWNRMPLFVRDLLETGGDWTPFQDVAVAMLDERTDEAGRLIEEGRALHPRDALWVLLAAALEVVRGTSFELPQEIGGANAVETRFTIHGSDTSRRDTRPLLAHVLALESPDWRVWAISDLLQLEPPQRGSMWATYLAARTLAEQGDTLAAEQLVRTLNRRWPTFAPAWDLHETVKFERLGRFDHIGMVRLREERRAALGRRPGEEAEERLSEAWNSEAQGDWEQALALVREAVELGPELQPAWEKLGEIQRQLGDYPAAVDAYSRATHLMDPESDSTLVQAYIETLKEGAQAEQNGLVPSEVFAELERLAEQFPDDPLAALAIAEAERDTEEGSKAIAVSRAYDRLARFRRHTGHAPLESLRDGSTALWKDFYQSLEPARAEEFVRAELDQRPGSLDLWIMLGETYEAQNRPEEAVRLYELVQTMVPSGKIQRAIARLLAHSGAEPAQVEQVVESAIRLEGRSEPDVELRLLLGQAYADGDAAERDRGIEILSELWDQRHTATAAASWIDIGQIYGTALVRRAEEGDRELAMDVLGEIEPNITDRPRQNLVQAIAHLARRIPTRRSERTP